MIELFRHAETLVLFENCERPSTEAISVVVPLFNYAGLVLETLDSVVEQLHLPIELVVVDDRSTDHSATAVRSWMQSNNSRFERCTLLQQPKNRGLAQARNCGWQFSWSEYVFFLDADNLLYPRALKRLIQALLESDCDAAYSQLEFFGDEVRLGAAEEFSKEKLVRGNYVDAMSLIKKTALVQLNGYETEGGWEDYDLWCKFVEAGLSALFVPEILCRYRVHGNSMLRTDTNKRAEEMKSQMLVRHPWLKL